MPRQRNWVGEGLVPGSCKIRKRGGSSSSSSSTVLQNYRFKRAILVGKPRGSRSGTPVPSWRTAAAAATAAESPKYAPSQGGGGGRSSMPVSARKLAATLWEMNEIQSPKVGENGEEKRRLLKKETRLRERVSRVGSVHSGSLPPHLSDPSHSPLSERIDRSGTGSRHRKPSSISHRLRLVDHNAGVLDSFSSASLMESAISRSPSSGSSSCGTMVIIETKSRGQTTTGSMVGVKTGLKDVSSALTTSKELLKIVNRIWARDDLPSSSMSLISALHAELERARLLVNQLIQEQRSEQNEINYIIKCFAEEKAAWKNKEQDVVEAAIESVAGELEVERKLRRRSESLNKKLGKELGDTKASLMKAVKELESEKRAREVIEHVCDDFARDIGKDKAEVEELKRESVKMYEEVEKEREMLHLADMLREERVQMKLSEAKHQFEEKNAAVDKLRNQLEAFMRGKRDKEMGRSSLSRGNTIDLAAYLSRTYFGSNQNEINGEDGEMDKVDSEEDSAESDLHSLELNVDNKTKSYRWAANSSGAGDHSRRPLIDDEMKGRNSASGKGPRKSTSLQRSTSGEVDWGVQSESLQKLGDGVDLERLYELEKQGQRKGYGNDLRGYISMKGLKDHILSSSRAVSTGDFASPTRQWGQASPAWDSSNTVQDRHTAVQVNHLASRLAVAKGEAPGARRSRR